MASRRRAWRGRLRGGSRAGCEADWVEHGWFDDGGGSSTLLLTCLAALRMQALPICTGGAVCLEVLCGGKG